MPDDAGTFTLAGTPLLTWIVTVAPSSSEAPPAGVCATTVPFGSAESTTSTSGVKFASASTFCRLARTQPDHVGDRPALGRRRRLEALDRHPGHHLHHEVVPDRRGERAAEHRAAVVQREGSGVPGKPDPHRRRDLRGVAGEVDVRVVLRVPVLPATGTTRSAAAVPVPPDTTRWSIAVTRCAISGAMTCSHTGLCWYSDLPSASTTFVDGERLAVDPVVRERRERRRHVER